MDQTGETSLQNKAIRNTCHRTRRLLPRSSLCTYSISQSSPHMPRKQPPRPPSTALAATHEAIRCTSACIRLRSTRSSSVARRTQCTRCANDVASHVRAPHVPLDGCGAHAPRRQARHSDGPKKQRVCAASCAAACVHRCMCSFLCFILQCALANRTLRACWGVRQRVITRRQRATGVSVPCAASDWRRLNAPRVAESPPAVGSVSSNARRLRCRCSHGSLYNHTCAIFNSSRPRIHRGTTPSAHLEAHMVQTQRRRTSVPLFTARQRYSCRARFACRPRPSGTPCPHTPPRKMPRQSGTVRTI